MNLPLDLSVAATGATLFDVPSAVCDIRVTTDTRSMCAGDTFLALRGENFDGHDYVAQAVRRGASMVVIDRAAARLPGVPTMLVGDGRSAYLALAGLARERFRGRVLAITGSAGKTTTKAFVSQLLAGRYGTRTIAAPGNENNELGVGKLLLRASNEEHDAIVVEMGARHSGDIAVLVSMARPHVGILTNVGDAHVEIMGSRERLAETKWALFGGGARAVLNADDAVSIARAPSLSHPPHWFLVRERGVALDLAGRSTALIGRSGLIHTDRQSVRECRIDVMVAGAHNRANVAAAIAGALEMGVELDAVVDIIPSLQLPPGRFESFPMTGGWRVIYDAYNANAGATMAALDALKAEPHERAIAVLGSMAELGAESAALHEKVGAHAARRAGVLVLSGDYADAMARGAETAGETSAAIVRVGSNADAARWLREHARCGDVVLLKGSRQYRLEEILEDLRS